MGIDLSRFKVIYKDRVLNALALERIDYRDNEWPGCLPNEKAKTVVKPLFLSVLCINEDGNIVCIFDEAWLFQFIPIIQREA